MRRRFLPFDELPAEPFAELPAELRSRELYEVGEWVNFVVDAAALEVLRAIGLEGDELETLIDAPMPERSDRVMALAERLGLAEDRPSCLVWIVDWLADPERTVGLAALRGLTFGEFPSLDEATRRAIEADARVRPHTELLALAASSYPAFLRGEEDGDRILFYPASLELWESFFSNEHRVVEGLNRLGAHAVEARVGLRTDLRILELGGGLGSAAEALLERLSPAVARYSFTDVAPGFLRRGRDLLLKRYPAAPVDVALVDINRACEEQRLERASYDIIYSVNVLHLARDLVSTLQAFRELLRPEGCMIFVEGVRPRPQRPIAAEFIFGLLPQFREVSTLAYFLPLDGFLSS